MGYYRRFNIRELAGRKIVGVTGLEAGSDKIKIVCGDGSEWEMLHDQDCCESVHVEEVIGDVSDLMDAVVLDAREEFNSDVPSTSEYSESHTWTFYIIQTNKGAVTIRWLGESNGYYSETAEFNNTRAGGEAPEGAHIGKDQAFCISPYRH